MLVLFNLMSGEERLTAYRFFVTSFFSAQLVSAQILSALFPLRNFCSVADLIFKFLACLTRMNFYQDIRKFVIW